MSDSADHPRSQALKREGRPFTPSPSTQDKLLRVGCPTSTVTGRRGSRGLWSLRGGRRGDAWQLRMRVGWAGCCGLVLESISFLFVVSFLLTRFSGHAGGG